MATFLNDKDLLHRIFLCINWYLMIHSTTLIGLAIKICLDVQTEENYEWKARSDAWLIVSAVVILNGFIMFVNAIIGSLAHSQGTFSVYILLGVLCNVLMSGAIIFLINFAKFSGKTLAMLQDDLQLLETNEIAQLFEAIWILEIISIIAVLVTSFAALKLSVIPAESSGQSAQ